MTAIPRGTHCGFGACKFKSESSREILAHQAVCPHREPTPTAARWVCKECGHLFQTSHARMFSHIENCGPELHRAAEVAIPPPVASGRAEAGSGRGGAMIPRGISKAVASARTQARGSRRALSHARNHPNQAALMESFRLLNAYLDSLRALTRESKQMRLTEAA